MQPDLWKDSYHRVACVSSLVCQSAPRKNNLNLVLRCSAANTFNYATFTLKFYCLHYWAGTRIRVRIPIPVCCPKTGLGLNPGDAVHSAVVSVTHFAPLSKRGVAGPLLIRMSYLLAARHAAWQLILIHDWKETHHLCCWPCYWHIFLNAVHRTKTGHRM